MGDMGDMGDIEMSEQVKTKGGKGGKRKKGKSRTTEEDENLPLLTSVVVDDNQPDIKLHFKVLIMIIIIHHFMFNFNN